MIPISTSRRAYEDVGEAPKFGTPSKVGHFSANRYNEVFLDERNLAYLRSDITSLPWRHHLDLTAGFGNFHEWHAPSTNLKTGARALIDEMCDYFVQVAKRDGHADIDKAVNGAKFVSKRGLLSRIARTVCNVGSDEGWSTVTRKVGNVIFLCEYLIPHEFAARADIAGNDVMTYTGYKFEDFLTVAKPNAEPNDVDHSFSNHDAYSRIFRNRFGTHELLYSSELDCMARESQLGLGRRSAEGDADKWVAVELKTQTRFENSRKEYNFYKFKACKWFMQSHIPAVDHLLIGYRNPDKTIDGVKYMSVKDLPTTARAQLGSGAFSPAVCMRFLNTVLDNVADYYADEGNKEEMLMYTWRHGITTLQVVKLRGEERAKHDFLPKKFKTHFGVK